MLPFGLYDGTASIRSGISWWETVQLDWLILRAVVTWHLLDWSFPPPFPHSLPSTSLSLCFPCLVTVLNVYLGAFSALILTPSLCGGATNYPRPAAYCTICSGFISYPNKYQVYTVFGIYCSSSKKTFLRPVESRFQHSCTAEAERALFLPLVGFKSSFRCCLAPPLAGDRNRNLLLKLLLLLLVLQVSLTLTRVDNAGSAYFEAVPCCKGKYVFR